MEFTGERVIPGKCNADLLNEHLARYYFARRYAQGKKVLDVACGAGYGTAILAGGAKFAAGLDIDQEALLYAREQYRSANLCFLRSDCLKLPFSDGELDLVVAFEILEHLKDGEGFIEELRRVLRPDGLLILSTPNRLYYTKDRGEVNPFHLREYSFSELNSLLKPYFPNYSILFENHADGLVIGHDAALAGSIEVETEGRKLIKDPGRDAYFFVALCSQQSMEESLTFLYLPSTGNVLREREKHIRLLEEDLKTTALEAFVKDKVIRELQSELEEMVRWGKVLDEQVNQKSAYILQLQADYDQKIQWALSLEKDLEKARAVLQQVQKELDERTAWALQLAQENNHLAQENDHLHKEMRRICTSNWYRAGKKLGLAPLPEPVKVPPESGHS